MGMSVQFGDDVYQNSSENPGGNKYKRGGEPQLHNNYFIARFITPRHCIIPLANFNRLGTWKLGIIAFWSENDDVQYLSSLVTQERV